MDRRNWLKGLTVLSLAGFARAGMGQKPAKGAVKVEDLQKNWKTLLADGADVATSMEPLKLADADGLIKPKAFVVLQQSALREDRAGLTEALQNHVKERIGVWKYPRWIEFADSLPKTATGKIQRYKLRA